MSTARQNGEDGPENPSIGSRLEQAGQADQAQEPGTLLGRAAEKLPGSTQAF